jgi:hypothetical protein
MACGYAEFRLRHSESFMVRPTFCRQPRIVTIRLAQSKGTHSGTRYEHPARNHRPKLWYQRWCCTKVGGLNVVLNHIDNESIGRLQSGIHSSLRRSSPKLDEHRTAKHSFQGPHLPETGNGLGIMRGGFVIHAVSGVAGSLSQLFGTLGRYFLFDTGYLKTC